jgi:hypothetical protein
VRARARLRAAGVDTERPLAAVLEPPPVEGEPEVPPPVGAAGVDVPPLGGFTASFTVPGTSGAVGVPTPGIGGSSVLGSDGAAGRSETTGSWETTGRSETCGSCAKAAPAPASGRAVSAITARVDLHRNARILRNDRHEGAI